MQFCGAVYYAVKSHSNVGLLDEVTIHMKATEQYFPVLLFIMLYKVVLTLGYWMKS